MCFDTSGLFPNFPDLTGKNNLRIDKRGLGHITFGEFEEFFKDEAVKAFFESLQIGAMDAWTLFVSLVSWMWQDTNKPGETGQT